MTRGSRLLMSLACWVYDRTLPLITGEVKPEGIDLNFIPLHPGETFRRMLGYEEFDASEMSLSAFLSSREQGRTFVGVPVFPFRVFRHSWLYVHRDARIKEPTDLKGKRIGTPEYQISACVWIRGILQHEYGVAPHDLEWHVERWGHDSHSHHVAFKGVKNVVIRNIPEGESIQSLLLRRELDAAFFPNTIPSIYDRSSLHSIEHALPVRRLFENFQDVEQAYFRKTGIFPIMHTLVVKKNIYDEHKWIPMSLLKAFEEAKQLAYRRLEEPLFYSVPWLPFVLEKQYDILGANPWKDGFKDNKQTLKTFIQYAGEQGIISRDVEPESLFAETVVHT